MKEIIDSYCGLKCYECKHKKQNECNGCIDANGNPLHVECKIAVCAKKNSRRFCSECGNFPCDLLNKESFDEAHGDNGQRIERCKELKKELVAEARKGINPVSVCGHHCDYCFLGQWCGGCRSNYNCCSYATIFPNGVCPNMQCANEKGLSGCYECDELVKCEKGYYEKKDEYIAKATALFIKEYGQDCYTKTLKKAIDDGVEYPETFDNSGSIENALNILRKYI